MQVSAINSNNFKGSSNDAMFERLSKESAMRDKVERFETKVQQIKSNVRPETCLLTAGAIILSVVKGKKVADIGAKGLAILGSFAKAGITKLNGTIANTAKGLFSKNFDKAKAAEELGTKVTNILSKGRQKAYAVGKADPKFVSNVKEYVNIFFKENKATGEKISEFITDKMGINSTKGLLSGLAAGVIGWKAGDGSGDALESYLDNAEIRKQYSKIFNDDVA